MTSPLSPPRELCLISTEEEKGADTVALDKEKDASTGDKVAEEVTEVQPTRDQSSGDSKAQKLKFHSEHGTNVKIEQGGSRVVKRDEKVPHVGIVFSHRPISIDERVCIRATGVTSKFSWLRFGVSNVDPASLKSEEILYDTETLLKSKGYWLNREWRFSEGSVEFSVSSTGNIPYTIDGQDKGIFLSGIDTSSPLWVIFDMWHYDLEGVEFGNLTEQKMNADNEEIPSTEDKKTDASIDEEKKDEADEEATEEQSPTSIDSSDGGRWRRHLSSGLNAAVTGAVRAANNIDLAVWIFILTVWNIILTVFIMTR